MILVRSSLFFAYDLIKSLEKNCRFLATKKNQANLYKIASDINFFSCVRV